MNYRRGAGTLASVLICLCLTAPPVFAAETAAAEDEPAVIQEELQLTKQPDLFHPCHLPREVWAWQYCWYLA